MEITPEFLNKFKKIFKKEFNRELSNEEALDKARRVLTFFSVIYRPLEYDEDDNQDLSDEL